MEGHCPVRVNCVASLLGVRRLFRIKICGITNADDARLAADAGADAIGLNFYAGSPRYVDIARAEAISAVLPAGVAKVGVFVNAAAREVAETAMRLALDYVQLHGEEPPEFLGEVAALSPVPILRALRFGPAGLTPLAEYLNRCDELGTSPPAVLVDAFSPAAFGGTGEAVDWAALASWRRDLPVENLVLAGGLRPENVRQALSTVRPTAVDVASGVESRPGRKDPQLVRDFIAAAMKKGDKSNY
jgi:phosphoribosylanthranilate isomerase